jgi:cytochrome c oxidase accessory protein FixG
LILGAVGLFLATALLGRVWCGFACPQTVWTDLYIWVERLFEGDRNARIIFDRRKWDFDKLLRKSGKHLVWLLIAALTGGAWVLYFADAPTTLGTFFTGEAGSGIYTFFGVFTGFTYLLAGWAREQVCIYMCPWPRFQAAMFDEDSLIVTYEAWRGEPRGFAKKDQTFENRGHCVDCSMCVQVCPTGTDIRKGSQLSCIGCALCIDACDAMMDRVGLPRGLITYDSINNQVARSKSLPTRIRFVRPRTIVYAALLAAVGSVMLFGLASRATTEVNVLHERSPLYVPLSDGSIRNGYTFKILNMAREDRVYTLTTKNLEGATMTVVGFEGDGTSSVVDLPVGGDSVGTFRVFVTAPRGALDGAKSELEFYLTDKASGAAIEHETLFAGPSR